MLATLLAYTSRALHHFHNISLRSSPEDFGLGLSRPTSTTNLQDQNVQIPANWPLLQIPAQSPLDETEPPKVAIRVGLFDEYPDNADRIRSATSRTVVTGRSVSETPLRERRLCLSLWLPL